MLFLTLKPNIAIQWQMELQIITKMHNKVNIFGIIEIGINGEKDIHSDDD